MTDHKHLKARVRARMAKTGERYAAARAHVVGDPRGEGGAGSPPGPGAGADVNHLTGADPETTGLRILLTHVDPGAPRLSEPLANVIAGGIGIGVFAFHYEQEGFSSFFLAGRHRWDDARAYLAGAAERLGWVLGTAEASAAATADRRLRGALERGPVIAWVDAASLGTRGLPVEMAGGGYHTLVVHRIDDAAGSATVSDLTQRPCGLPRALLSAARAGMAFREDSHFYATKVIPPLRRAYRELGRRLVAAGVIDDVQDVYHLRFEELASMTDDDGALPASLRQRYRPLVLARAAKRRELEGIPLLDPALLFQHARRSGGALVSGTAASRGRAEGPVRIIRGPDEFGRLRSGDILMELDGAPVTGPDALLRQLASNAIGRTMPARLIRGGRLAELELTPAERTPARAAA